MTKKKVKDELQRVDIPYKIKMSLTEAEALSRLKDSPEWEIYKRVSSRYIENLMKSCFNINPSSQSLSVKHADYAAQAFGIKYMARLVDNIKVELFEKEKNASNNP
jgi:hypothetical protein